MAIITLDCNLNGGDSVTPNNELYYRIYGDVDAYADPIHTTGTALNDDNVTVDNDTVIITGVDGTTNTEFKIAAVDGAGNEGILSDALFNTILFQDDFIGTTIDTNKWDIQENDGANLVFSQDDGLIITRAGNSITESLNSAIMGKNSFTADLSTDPLIISYDMQTDTEPNLGLFAFGIKKLKDLSINDNYICNNERIVDGTFSHRVRLGDTNLLLAFSTYDLSVRTSLKIICFPNGNVQFHYWNGTIWVQFSTGAIGGATVDGTWFPLIAAGDNTSANITRVWKYSISTEDYSTQYPI